jgi:hypothetical protein
MVASDAQGMYAAPCDLSSIVRRRTVPDGGGGDGEGLAHGQLERRVQLALRHTQEKKKLGGGA